MDFFTVILLDILYAQCIENNILLSTKKTSLWERAQTALFHAENPLATRRASQQGQSDDENNVNDSKEKFKID
ncbi:MAG: hypothetical protein IKO41_06515 [Lachnospiraceae bacterium]|nr:hypothetical protein [Lachnospiraceae bacterium]